MKKIKLFLLTILTGFCLQTFGQVNSENGFRFKNNTQMKGLVWGNTNWANYYSRIDDYNGQLRIMTDDNIYFTDINTANGTPLNTALYINTNSGTVGIGTTNPNAKLHIVGNYNGGSGDYTGISNAPLRLQSTVGYIRIPYISADASVSAVYNFQTGKNVYWGESTDTGNYFFRGRNLLVQNGNVGIGTTTPDATLAVNGDIHTQEVRVDMTGWPDFVFKKDYSLPTLDEVENHIKAKGHLKDMPSEAEVKANGINLGEMDAKLLQKIEELTLYTIEQDKTLRQQQKLIEAIHQELNLMKQENKSLRNTVEHLKNK